MSITTVQANALVRRISAYTQASLDDSWKGGGDPDDKPEIELELKRATRELNKYIQSLVKSKGKK